MQLFPILAAAMAMSPAAALPRRQTGGCTDLSKRIEWRELDPAHQQDYIKAVLCLKTKPSRIGLNTPLYDDFSHVHFNLSNFIHGNAPFLPWHRYFTKVHENALRECGYNGPGTYWDWTRDAEAGLLSSPVMSSDHGFGGNGSRNKTEINPSNRAIPCVDSGPFAKLRPEYLAIDPKTIVGGGHCLWRELPEVFEPAAYATMKPIITPEGVAKVQAMGNWSFYHGELEGGPHGIIHASLGGDMNPTTSPNEPLFFLHHAQIDRLWWLWQQENSTRLFEYGDKALLPNLTEPKTATLDDPILMGGLTEDVTVRDVMDTRSELLCYTY